MKRFILAEFGSPEALAAAIGELREAGYNDFDAYTPYSTEIVREALAWKRSRLPIVVFVAGIAGATCAYSLQWYLVAYLYPLNVGGRPPHSPLAYVPITFEMGVLFAAVTAMLGVLIAGRLLRLWHPVFEVPGFDSASVDKFWLSVGLPPDETAGSKALELLGGLGASRTCLAGDEVQ